MQKNVKKSLKNYNFYKKYKQFLHRFRKENDRIIIKFYDTEKNIDVFFRIIDDITSYLTNDIGFYSMDFAIEYDDDGAYFDRYSIFF